MVRTFPRATRLRLVAAGVACTVAGTLVLVVPTAYGDNLHDRQHHAKKQVRHAQGDLDESSKELSAATRKLERSRAALTSARNRLEKAQQKLASAEEHDAEMQDKLEEAEHQLALAREAVEAARAQVAEMRRRIGELAADNYANGDPALMGLVVMLNSQDPAEVTSQMNTIDSLMNRQDVELERLREAREQLKAREAEVEAATAAVAQRRRDAAELVVQMQALRRDAISAKRKVAAAFLQQRKLRDVAERIRRADLVKLHAAQRQERRIKRLILARARAQARRHHRGFQGSTGGFLMRPVPGVVTSPYGYRRHPIYGYWGLHDGTDFSAPCGTPLRASASGTVISRFWSDVYGNRMYVDVGRVNGHSLTLVYNHASSYRVGVGAHVSRGETLGWAGSTGWSTGCHLHFTVLRDGGSTDPMNYM